MRLHQFAFVALLGLSVPTALYAQSSTPASTSTSTNSGSGWLGGSNRWIASGLVGANYSNNSSEMSGSTNVGSTGSNNSQRSADYAASVGYLWHNALGGEFLASFTPNFQMQNTLAPVGSEPNVNSYMANAIGAVPLGGDGQWAPYVSGGFGAITLRGVNGDSNTSSNNGNAVANAAADTGQAVANALNPDETRAGGNIGVGLMAFLGNVGVRGDVRYFRAFENDSSTSSNGTSTSGTEFLPGLTFWRANVGVAFRW